MDNILVFENVSKIFNQTLLLSNITFSIKKHNITTLIGHNGSGKTTIAKLILGLEKPSSGKIFLNQNLQLGYVPQKIEFNKNLPITVENFLRLLFYSKVSSYKDLFLKFCDYDNIKYHSIFSLSGGQMQKLLIAGTLMNSPQLLILDEPTQSLDFQSQIEFYELLNFIKYQLNISVFIISHDLFTVMKNSDQVICIYDNMCCSGIPEDLSKNNILSNLLSSLGFYGHNHK